MTQRGRGRPFRAERAASNPPWTSLSWRACLRAEMGPGSEGFARGGLPFQLRAGGGSYQRPSLEAEGGAIMQFVVNVEPRLGKEYDPERLRRA